MANTYLALADLVKLNDLNDADIDVSDILDEAPFLKALAATESSNGTTHSYTKETTAPVVGFRSVNDGRENSDSEDTEVSATLKILDASFDVDQALARAYRKGEAAFVAREAARHLKAAMFAFEKQVINGVLGVGSSSGFVGLRDTLVLANAMTYNAAGSTANTGSSLYAVRTGSDMRDLALVAGGPGETPTIEIGETVTIQKEGSSTGFYPAWYTPIFAWLGLQLGSAYSIGRICNLTADSGKGLTDDKIAELLALFPASRQPNYLVCNRRSLKQLQQSRTATNATGAPAPFPTDAFGIPLIVTDAIASTEAILS